MLSWACCMLGTPVDVQCNLNDWTVVCSSAQADDDTYLILEIWEESQVRTCLGRFSGHVACCQAGK